MKVLLFNAYPPTKQFSGGIMLEQLCKMLKRDSVVSFSAKDPSLEVQMSEGLSWMPYEIANAPREYGKYVRKFIPGALGELAAFAAESLRERMIEKNIINRAVSFGKDNDVDCVWAVLQGRTVIISARKIAQKLGVPLLTHIWDDPSWALREANLDKRTEIRALAEYDSAIKSSSACATASIVMSKEYKDKYSIKTFAFLGSLEKELARAPANSLVSESGLTIGLAGQLYALKEWDALVGALESSNWKIRGRKVKILLIGHLDHIPVPRGAPVEKVGHKSLEETIEILSSVDVTYCPYWFAKEYEPVARTSFPCKLTAYLAAGRSVFFHGPTYASPAHFIEDNNAGICCYSLEASEILEKLSSLVENVSLYQRLATNGRRAFDKYLTLDVLEKEFVEFLSTPFHKN
jgi:glycosyltransferase involved in cell wall biosynthesis